MEDINQIIQDFKICKDEINRSLLFEKILFKYKGFFIKMRPYNIPQEDWLQECGIEIFNRIQTFDHTKSDFITYIYWNIYKLKSLSQKQHVIELPRLTEKNKNIQGNFTVVIGGFDFDRIKGQCIDSLKIIDEIEIRRFYERKLKFNSIHLSIISYILDDYTLREMGTELGISAERVRQHIFDIKSKLDGTTPYKVNRSAEAKQAANERQTERRKTKKSKEYFKKYSKEYRKIGKEKE